MGKAEQVNASMIIVVKHDKSWLTRLIEGQSVSHECGEEVENPGFSLSRRTRVDER